MENLEKNVISFLLTIGIIWISQGLLGWISDWFKNIYLSDFVLFLYPPIFTTIACLLFYRKREIQMMISIVVGGIIYCSVLYFSIAWGLNEMGCTRYFFNLFTNCP